MRARTTLGALAFGILLLGAPAPGRAQQHPWQVGLIAGQAWFTAAAAGNGTSLAPSPGLKVGVDVRRRVGPWEVGVGLDTRPAVLRAVDHGATIEVAGASMARTGLVLGIARPVVRGPNAWLMLEGRWRVDSWRLAGDASRWRLAPEMALGLQFAAGAITVGHRLAIGRSASPFRQEDLPPGYRPRALMWVELGVELRGRR